MALGTCPRCGKEFDKNTTWQRYCSDTCRTYVNVNALRSRKKPKAKRK